MRHAEVNDLSFTLAENDLFRSLFAHFATERLDADTIDMVAREGVDALADDDFEFYLALAGDRNAWQIAMLGDGARVGFIIPSKTAYDASYRRELRALP